MAAPHGHGLVCVCAATFPSPRIVSTYKSLKAWMGEYHQQQVFIKGLALFSSILNENHISIKTQVI